jgi:hypothetical protein
VPLPPDKLCGLIGSLLLLVAPLRDQILRWRSAAASHRDRPGRPLRELWTDVKTGYDRRRDGWSFLDSLTLALGAILIGASYVL